MTWRSLVIPAGLLAIAGCCQAPPCDDCYVAMAVDSLIDRQVEWQALNDEALLEAAVDDLLQKELSLDAAVQVALLYNPDLQAVFEEIGIAHADLIEAGLIQNPLFAGFVRFPSPSSFSLNTEFSITQNFVDILLMPLRRRVAEAEFVQAQLRVTQAILDLSFEVQDVYYRLLAEQQKQSKLETLLEANDLALELAKAQQAHGNINELELQKHRIHFLEANVALSNNQLEIVQLRNDLRRLMGMEPCHPLLTANTSLSHLPADETSLGCLADLALSVRQDFQVAKWEIAKIERLMDVQSWWSYTDASVGISTAVDAESIRSTGPTFGIALPLFNYGQADRKRLQAMYRQSVAQLRSMELDILAQIHSAYARLQLLRQLLVLYQQQLLPLQQSIVETSQQFYTFMSLSLFKLFEAKQEELRLEIQILETQRDYWLAQVELDRALGGNLSLLSRGQCR